MPVQKIGFVGFRTPDLAGFRRILEDGLGLSPSEASDTQVQYRLVDGTRLEGYSEANAFHEFFTTGPVVGFSVEDFDDSWARLTAMGVAGLTDIQEEDGLKWVHFRLPDGNVAELIGGTGAKIE